MLNVPIHLEDKISAIIEAYDMTTMSQKNYMVATEPEAEAQTEKSLKISEEIVVRKIEDSKTCASYEDDFYNLEELDQLENKIMTYMAKKFSNLKFIRNPKFRSKNTQSRFQNRSSSGSGIRRGYKTGMVDRSKISCCNYNELGHLVT